jgi:carboxypeptidase T
LTHLGELFRGVITYHSYSQLILYPWGYTLRPIPDASDLATMTKLAERMAQLIKGVHGSTYRPQQSSRLYRTAGDTTDWTYGEYAIPSFTIELRPDSLENGGFILPPEQIQPTFEENLPAALEFIQRIL